MGFYDRHVLPHLLNVFMDTKAVGEQRQRTLEHVHGEVLEIGFGSGLNIPYYSTGVTKLIAVDPSYASAKLARRRIAAAPFRVEIVGLSAEKIPVPDASSDAVVSTFTLCTIPDVAAALREVHRTLKPGGHFYFLEHGRADDPRVVRWQERLNGLQQSICGGCHLNRAISSLIGQAGFDIETIENEYLRGAPKFAGYLYRGVATRPV